MAKFLQCCAATVIGLFAAATTASGREPPRIELVAHGVLSDLELVGRRDATGSSDGSIGEIAGDETVVPTEATDRIPAKLGLRFGITFVVANRGTFETVPVEIRVTHPPFELPDGRVVTVDSWPASAQGVPRATGWSFDHAYELVPGEWTIAVVHEGRVSAEKRFCVGTPRPERCPASE